MKYNPYITNNMHILDRIQAPTPALFRKIRRIGVIIGGIGAAIAASPVALPIAITSLAGYLILSGTIITSISSLPVDGE